MHLQFLIAGLLLISVSCNNGNSSYTQLPSHLSQELTKSLNPEEIIIQKFRDKQKYISSGFDFPVGPPDAKGYYDAQPFGKNLHLGEDWNGNGGTNTDLGDPVFSISEGWVSQVKDYAGGWGNVVRIIHAVPKSDSLILVESLYAHLDSILISAGEFVNKGQQIGSIGNVGGIYYAHLHFELRNDITLPLGPGYSDNTNGYLNPSEFIKKHRTLKKLSQ